jgi:hypothetical protein
MDLSDGLEQELSTLLEETGEKISNDYYFAFWELLDRLDLPHSENPVPLTLWVAMAQAFADASGYRISLQGAVLKPRDAEQIEYRIVGYREVAGTEPTLFVAG